MKEIKYISKNAKETQKLGQKIAGRLWDKSWLLLSGELGAGKTCFTQGLAKGLGITVNISSPTFTLLKIYEEGKMPLYHLDAYRLEAAYQDVGFSDILGLKGVSVVEWPEFVQALLPDEYLKIDFSFLEAEKRELKITALGDKYTKLLEDLLC